MALMVVVICGHRRADPPGRTRPPRDRQPAPGPAGGQPRPGQPVQRPAPTTTTPTPPAAPRPRTRARSGWPSTTTATRPGRRRPTTTACRAKPGVGPLRRRLAGRRRALDGASTPSPPAYAVQIYGRTIDAQSERVRRRARRAGSRSAARLSVHSDRRPMKLHTGTASSTATTWSGSPAWARDSQAAHQRGRAVLLSVEHRRLGAAAGRIPEPPARQHRRHVVREGQRLRGAQRARTSRPQAPPRPAGAAPGRPRRGTSR